MPDSLETRKRRYAEDADYRRRAIARAKEWQRAHPERVRSWALRKRYGITVEDYEAKLAEQGGLCALCHQPPGAKRLAVDHDHATGNIRGLLCVPCNVGLHWFEDAKKFDRMTTYLERT